MKNIFVLVVLLVTTCVYADQIVSRDGDVVTVVASGEYIMGDSDNRKEARMMALMQAKTNASEVAGTYIESNFESVTKQINGDSVDKVTKQELRSFSAAILQSEITNDTMEMLVNKTTVYKVSIKARIDLATLRERVKQLGEDKAKKDRLISLEKENKDLSSALEKLSGQMRILENAKSVKPEEIKALRDERERLFTKMEKNEGVTKLIFEKGLLLNEYQEKKARAKEIQAIVRNIYENHLSEYIHVNLSKPVIKGESAGSFYGEMKYEWYFDYKKLINHLLTNYGIKAWGDDYVNIEGYESNEYLLVEYPAYIVFSLDKERKILAFDDKQFFRNKPNCFLYNVNKYSGVHYGVFSFYIKSEELKSLDSVTTEIIVVK